MQVGVHVVISTFPLSFRTPQQICPTGQRAVVEHGWGTDDDEPEELLPAPLFEVFEGFGLVSSVSVAPPHAARTASDANTTTLRG